MAMILHLHFEQTLCCFLQIQLLFWLSLFLFAHAMHPGFFFVLHVFFSVQAQNFQVHQNFSFQPICFWNSPFSTWEVDQYQWGYQDPPSISRVRPFSPHRPALWVVGRGGCPAVVLQQMTAAEAGEMAVAEAGEMAAGQTSLLMHTWT
jgi:hypothetical protein